MERSDVQFIQENIIHFEAVKLGYTKNLSHETLGKYEEMYRKYLDPQFILTYWCGACVFDMLQRLSRHYENFMNSVSYGPSQPIETPIQKKKK